MKKPKIGIIGLGMVGTPVRRYFEEIKGYCRGKDLFCYDNDAKKGFFDDIRKADVIFICVPTPADKKGKLDASIIKSAFRKIGKEGKIVVIKSTLMPTSTEQLQKLYPQHKIVFNPEFLTESQAWYDFIKPDRQIVGYTGQSIDASMAVLSLLPPAPFMSPWGHGCYTSHRVSASEAEMGKIAANSFGAVKVAFANILADVAMALEKYFKQQGMEADVDYENIRKIISADHRIGPSWLDVNHGNYCGFGGYCFPKDFRSFINFFDDLIGALKKDKKNKDIIVCLKNGQQVLRAIWDYNETLLGLQNLTMKDVAQHDKDIILKKRKKIRYFFYGL